MIDTTVSIIVAASKNNCIGRDNDLLWRIPGDLKRLKEITMGKPLVMGRKTHESVSNRRDGHPLPGRVHFAISRTMAQPDIDGIFVCRSLDQAIKDAETYAQSHGQNEIIIFGGAEIYKQALPYTDKIYLTRIHESAEGDAFFPKIAPEEWTEVSKEDHKTEDGLEYSYVYLEKK